ncbi:MAG: hypothetical protein V3S71_02735 [Acidobacteriota bacterium]
MSFTYTGYTEEALSAAFDAVACPEDWRAPIEARLPAPLDPELVTAAVEFYTSTTPTFLPLSNGETWISARGYRDGPAGP